MGACHSADEKKTTRYWNISINPEFELVQLEVVDNVN